MKFSRIIGRADKDLIRRAEDKLSSVFTELSLNYDNKAIGSGIGGDPLVFQLVYPIEHICDATAIQFEEDAKKVEESIEKKKADGTFSEEEKEKLPDFVKSFRRRLGGKLLRTAATDGKRYYWNPEFVAKQSKLGLRIVVAHEAWHAIYMHPSRRGARLPQLWNIAVDYKVNYTIIEDFRTRGIKDNVKIFTDNLGEFITLKEYADFLKDPFNPPPRLAHLNPIHNLKKMADPAYKDPGDDTPPMYFADSALSDDMKRPENIYEYLLAQIPKCPKCGRLGKYKKPDQYKQLQKQIQQQQQQQNQKGQQAGQQPGGQQPGGQQGQKGQKGQQGQQGQQPGQGQGSCCDPNHNHGPNGEHCDHDDPNGQGQGQGQPQQGQGQGQPQQGQGQQGQGQPQQGEVCCDDKGCSECGGDDSEYIDPFGAGDTLDDHIDSDISEEELGKRITDAMEIARKMAGKVPGALEDELGELIAPKLTWQDFVRSRLHRARVGFGKNDWTRPKTRPMFAGLYVPKKRDYFVKFMFAYDCSGSMSQQDIAYGVSQAQVIDERGEGWLVPWDTQPYWEAALPIKKSNADELKKAKVKGRGGTMVGAVFKEYEDNIGKVDLIMIATDGYLYDGELRDVAPPKNVDVVWLITSHNPNFKPPFGRVFHLRNE